MSRRSVSIFLRLLMRASRSSFRSRICAWLVSTVTALSDFWNAFNNKRLQLMYWTPKMTFGLIKGGKLRYVIMDKVIWEDEIQKRLGTHAIIEVTCFPTFVGYCASLQAFCWYVSSNGDLTEYIVQCSCTTMSQNRLCLSAFLPFSICYSVNLSVCYSFAQLLFLCVS